MIQGVLCVYLRHCVRSFHFWVNGPKFFMRGSGKPKPLWFDENKERFKEWPIRALNVQIQPEGDDHAKNAWAREFGTRQSLGAHLQTMNLPEGTPIITGGLVQLPEKCARCKSLHWNGGVQWVAR